AVVERLRVGPAATGTGRAAGRRIAAAVGLLDETLAAHGTRLGDLDAGAGDGDHGLGMCRGASAARGAAEEAGAPRGGARGVPRAAADAWADKAGGTSGALWGAGLQAMAYALAPDGAITPADIATGFRSALDQIVRLGGARPGDKTLVDALDPFVARFTEDIDAGEKLAVAWAHAAARADHSAQATAGIPARLGRARVLGGRSVGTPDPRAT